MIKNILNLILIEQNSIYDKIRNGLKDLDIGVLVNNVGIANSPDFFDAFAKSDKTIDDMINCNIISVTKMTAIVLPSLIKKNKGVIINIASVSGRTAYPLLTVYAATKAYVDFFSRLNIIFYFGIFK